MLCAGLFSLLLQNLKSIIPMTSWYTCYLTRDSYVMSIHQHSLLLPETLMTKKRLISYTTAAVYINYTYYMLDRHLLLYFWFRLYIILSTWRGIFKRSDRSSSNIFIGCQHFVRFHVSRVFIYYRLETRNTCHVCIIVHIIDNVFFWASFCFRQFMAKWSAILRKFFSNRVYIFLP